MKTLVTIEIDTDKLNLQWRKEVDTHVGESNLKIYQSYAWHLLASAASSGLAEVKVEVVE